MTVPTGNTYDKYASSNPIERRLMSGFWSAFDAALPTAATSVLEVGIGEGEVMTRVRSMFPEARIVGVDLPDPDLQTEWRDVGLSAMCADGAKLPFPDNSFDLCLAIEVMEHVDEPNAVLAEIRRVSTDVVVLSVPREPLWRIANMARGSYLAQLGNTPGHVNHWSSKGFRRFVEREFSIIRSATPFPWTMVAARTGDR